MSHRFLALGCLALASAALLTLSGAASAQDDSPPPATATVGLRLVGPAPSPCPIVPYGEYPMRDCSGLTLAEVTWQLGCTPVYEWTVSSDQAIWAEDGRLLPDAVVFPGQVGSPLAGSARVLLYPGAYADAYVRATCNDDLEPDIVARSPSVAVPPGVWLQNAPRQHQVTVGRYLLVTKPTVRLSALKGRAKRMRLKVLIAPAVDMRLVRAGRLVAVATGAGVSARKRLRDWNESRYGATVEVAPKRSGTLRIRLELAGFGRSVNDVRIRIRP